MASDVTEKKRAQMIKEYRKRFPTSEKLYRRAVKRLPGGVTHIKRTLAPFPVYVDHAKGSRKWDVDGNELVDYWVGHGSLILGHLHPEVFDAVKTQLDRATHPGACHELEVRWAELIIEMIPCAEMVRFTSSGTEATHMALRLSRAFTGRKKVIKFAGHFHGWHNDLVMSVDPPLFEKKIAGIPQEVLRNTIVLPASDIDLVDRTLTKEEVACIILEPTGASYGQNPLRPGFLAELRDVTSKHDVILIFDEVITGFRCSPGGAQQHFGVTPDLTTLGKIVAGGLPGAAVTGRREIMDLLTGKGGDERSLRHPGTYNANPVSAIAGVKTLELLKDGKAIQRADAAAAAVRKGMQEIVAKAGIDWLPYGDFSFFHILTHADGADPEKLWEFDQAALKKGADSKTKDAFRCGMLLHGVDTAGMKGFVSAEHNRDDVERTLDAFEKTLRILF